MVFGVYSFISFIAGILACTFILAAVVYSPGSRMMEDGTLVLTRATDRTLESHQVVLEQILILFRMAFTLLQEVIEDTPPKDLPLQLLREAKGRDIPLELLQKLVDMLKDDADTLRRLASTSKSLNTFGRRAEFRQVKILSVDSLVRLASLLSSHICTVPRGIDSLHLQIAPPQVGSRIPHRSVVVRNTLSVVFRHFRVHSSLCLDLPWAISRHLDWSRVGQYRTIREFTLHGAYPSLLDILPVLASMFSLEVLTITASFARDTSNQSIFNIVAPLGSVMSSELKEVTLSPASLQIMHWMSLLEHGPEKLHLVRIKVDDVGNHAQHFSSFDVFMQMYGRRLARLCIWFEEIWDLDHWDEGSSNAAFLSLGPSSSIPFPMTVLSDALRHTPQLRQLKLLLPCMYDADAVNWHMDNIRMHLSQSTAVSAITGDNVGVDESEFWDTPFLCVAPPTPGGGDDEATGLL